MHEVLRGAVDEAVVESLAAQAANLYQRFGKDAPPVADGGLADRELDRQPAPPRRPYVVAVDPHAHPGVGEDFATQCMERPHSDGRSSGPQRLEPLSFHSRISCRQA